MLFCQLAKADSLREICHGLSSCLGKLVHLGISSAPNKSTLSYANERRSHAFFEALFWRTLYFFRSKNQFGGGRGHSFRFKNKLLSLDSTTISLCLSLFPWAKYRYAKGGVKLHVLLDHDDYLPQFAHITSAKTHDLRIARKLHLTKGSIVAMDRGYNDYSLFDDFISDGIFFVTRLKENTLYEIVETRLDPKEQHVLSDVTIRLTGQKADEKCPHLLRLVVVWDEKNLRRLELLTNHLTFCPATIAAVYKERWQIELFFKTLKQNLKIKTFVGTSQNALRIQIWTALIALMLIRWLHYLSKARWSFSVLASLLRLNLFTYRDLQKWLNEPWDTPPIIPASKQLSFDKLFRTASCV